MSDDNECSTCYLHFDKDWNVVFNINALLELNRYSNYGSIETWQRCFPNKCVYPPWKQQIQLMDAHSLPHAYLESAIATFVKVGRIASTKLSNFSYEYLMR